MGSDDAHDKRYHLLDENSTEKFFIEYQRGLFNHMSHALYALDSLQAPVPLTEEFVAWSAKEKMEHPETSKTREKPRAADLTYYIYLRQYGAILKDDYSGDFEKMIRVEFPKLSPGMLASALHGLIHIGYGCAAQRGWFVVEGLAYLKSTYLPFNFKKPLPQLSTLGSGDKSILEVVKLIRQDNSLVGLINEVKASLSENARFSNKSSRIIDKQSDRLAELVHQIKFPDGLNAQAFTPDKLPELIKWLIDCTIIVSTIVEKRNDFFLLHGVTSSWALGNVLPLMRDEGEIMSTIRTFLCSLLIVYLVQDYPALNRNLLEQNDGMSHTWEDLIQKAIVHQDHEREHQFKLVQVCKDMSDKNTDPRMESLYRLAAYNCITYPYDF